jgi:hypothetical protein
LEGEKEVIFILGILFGLVIALFMGYLYGKRKELPRFIMPPWNIPFVDEASAWDAIEGMRALIHKFGWVSVGHLADYAFGPYREFKGVDYNYTYGWTSIPSYCKPVREKSIYTISGLPTPKRIVKKEGSP